MLSLSTAWFSDPLLKTRDAIEQTRRMGFTEIEWGIAPFRPDADEIASAVAAGDIAVSSIHALAGFADGHGVDPRGSQLGSTDRKRRRISVDALRRTVELARRIGARAVVTHAGTIGEGPLRQRIAALVSMYASEGASPTFLEEVASFRESRNREAPGALERTIESLAEVARKEGPFPIGIEVHYYYSDLPLPDELQQMCDALGDWLGYWHDCGHARMMQIFAGVPELSWIERFRDRLRGIHLHDMIGVRDHRPPGTGEIDYTAISRLLDGVPCARVIELASEWTADEVAAGRRHLESIGKW